MKSPRNFGNQKADASSESETTLDPILDPGRGLYTKLLGILSVCIAFYAGLFFYYGDVLAPSIWLGGLIFLHPFLYLKRNDPYRDHYALVLAVLASFYVFAAELSQGYQLESHLFYLPAMLIAILLINDKKNVHLFSAMAVPVGLWFSSFFLEDTFSGFSTQFNLEQVETINNINFLASFMVGTYAVLSFSRLIRKAKEVEIKKLSDEIDEIAEITFKYEESQKISKIGNWSFDVESGEIHWSGHMFDLFPESIENGPPGFEQHKSTIHPDDRDHWEKTVQECLQTAKPYLMRFRSVFPDGKILRLEARGHAVLNQNFKVSKLYGTCQDITEQTLLEESRKQMQILHEAVFANIPCMVFVKSYHNEMRFEFLNRAGEKLIGVKQEELLGKNDFDFFPKEQAEFFVSKDLDVFKRGEVLHVDKEPIDTPNGKRYLKTFKVPTYLEDGSPHLLIGISLDITDEIQLKEDLESQRTRAIHNSKLASLGEMAAGVAHEVNNPLGVISGSLSLLKKSINDPERIQKGIHSIEKASIRIQKIVTGLKKFSRAPSKTNYERIDLKSVVEEALIVTEAKLDRHNFKVELDLAGETFVRGDMVELEQVFINLVNNAVDATKDSNSEKKWIKIQSLHVESDHSDPLIIVRVLDSGSGIDEELEAKLFRPFFTTKAPGDGTGLGLSITKGILEEHGARIFVNRDYKNTCFEIHFEKYQFEKYQDEGKTVSEDHDQGTKKTA